MRITGSRICGSHASTATASTFTFSCPELPARVPSGWKLTPGWEGATDKAGRARANRTVVLNVSTPLATEIDVELVRGGTQLNLPLEAVNPVAAGSPGDVAATGRVGITAFDESSRRMWMIEIVVSTCADSRHLQVFNRAARDPERSVPLEVHLIREVADQVCIGQAGTNPATRAGVGDPVNPRAAGGCAGGGTGKAFDVCETCPSLPPEGLRIHASGTYCSWDEVLQVFGYDGGNALRARLCRLSQVSGREACEGKPSP